MNERSQSGHRGVIRLDSDIGTAQAAPAPGGDGASIASPGDIARRLAWACGLGFVALTVLVVAGLTQPVDDFLMGVFRPHDAWGPLQLNVDHIVEGLRPVHVIPAVVLLALLLALWRRSWWPLVVAGTALVAGALVTLATKVVVSRPDPHGGVGVGSYPSGHTLSVMLAFGVAALLLGGAGARWWYVAAPAAGGLVMGTALLIEGAHWTSDVVGGALLATAVLAGIWASPLREPRERPR